MISLGNDFDASFFILPKRAAPGCSARSSQPVVVSCS